MTSLSCENELNTAIAALLAFEPTPNCEWNRWDRLVYRVTGSVSERVYRDRLECLARDKRRMATRVARVEAAKHAARNGYNESKGST